MGYLLGRRCFSVNTSPSGASDGVDDGELDRLLEGPFDGELDGALEGPSDGVL